MGRGMRETEFDNVLFELGDGYTGLFFFSDRTARLTGSQFPNQGLNPGHSSESAER